MTKKQTAIWWVYAIVGIGLIYFLAPALISAADTFLVLLGVLLLVLFAVWSWRLWGKSLAKLIAGAYREL